MAEYLKLQEVARRLDVSEKTARRYVKSGTLPSVFIGGAYRVSEADLDEFLQNAKVEPGKAPVSPSLEPSLFNGLEEERRSPMVARAVSEVAETWRQMASKPDASLYEISAAVDAALTLGEALIERFDAPPAAGFSAEQWEVIRLAARLLEISKAGNERILDRGEDERYRARKEQIREMTRRISA